MVDEEAEADGEDRERWHNTFPLGAGLGTRMTVSLQVDAAEVGLPAAREFWWVVCVLVILEGWFIVIYVVLFCKKYIYVYTWVRDCVRVGITLKRTIGL